MAIKKEKIEVFIPTWNSAKTLRKCLTALRRQFDGYCLVIDRFSSDETEKIAKEFCDMIKSNDNLGKVRTNAIRMCRTPFIFFLDSDVYLTEDYLNKMLSFLETHQECGAVHGIGVKLNTTYQKYQQIIAKPTKKIIKPERGYTGATLIRTDVAKGFRTNVSCFEDWLLTRFIREKGFEWLQIPIPLFHDQGDISNIAKWNGANMRVLEYAHLWSLILALVFVPLARTRKPSLFWFSFKLQFWILYGFLNWDKYEEKFGRP